MKPLEKYGYGQVGAGWRFILEALDLVLANVVMNARVNAVALPQFRDEENTEQADITVNQVKEKFGGLRVYLDFNGISQRFHDEVEGAVMMAERMAAIHCEQCGSREGVENRGVKDKKKTWTLTLCRDCHKKRDDSFERGDNGMD